MNDHLTIFGNQIGRVLPLIARSVTRSVLPDIPHEEVDYNIVQNNGESIVHINTHPQSYPIPFTITIPTSPPYTSTYPKHPLTPPNQTQAPAQPK